MSAYYVRIVSFYTTEAILTKFTPNVSFGSYGREKLFLKRSKIKPHFKHTKNIFKHKKVFLFESKVGYGVGLLYDVVYDRFPRNVPLTFYRNKILKYQFSQTISSSVQTTNNILTKLSADLTSNY